MRSVFAKTLTIFVPEPVIFTCQANMKKILALLLLLLLVPDLPATAAVPFEAIQAAGNGMKITRRFYLEKEGRRTEIQPGRELDPGRIVLRDAGGDLLRPRGYRRIPLCSGVPREWRVPRPADY